MKIDIARELNETRRIVEKWNRDHPDRQVALETAEEATRAVYECWSFYQAGKRGSDLVDPHIRFYEHTARLPEDLNDLLFSVEDE